MNPYNIPKFSHNNKIQTSKQMQNKSEIQNRKIKNLIKMIMSKIVTIFKIQINF